MPVYNGQLFLREAIESILEQTYSNFEFLIINDGSTDESGQIIKSYVDQRIKYVENESNLKLIATLNKGIELAKGEYIARMDADDVSLPERLAKQVAFMDSHPQVGLLGTFLLTKGLNENYQIGFATHHDKIKFKLFFDTHFPHPAAMLRKSVLIENNLQFDKAYIHAEDFELWNRMAEVCRLAIIPEILVHKRSHEEQISVKHIKIQDEISRKIRQELMNKLGVFPSEQAMDVYEGFLKKIVPREQSNLNLLLELIEQLVVANNILKKYNNHIFNHFFAEQYWQLCARSTHLGWWVFNKYRSSVFYKEKIDRQYPQFNFFMKSLIRYSYND